MDILKIAAVALSGVLLSSILKSINKEVSLYVILSTAVIILFSLIDNLGSIFSFMENIYKDITYGREFFPIILKVLTVAYITDFTAQICKDAGEASIGNKVELAGKITIFYLAIPIFTAIIELIETLLE